MGRMAARFGEKSHDRVSSGRERDNDNNCIVGSERDVCLHSGKYNIEKRMSME